MASGTEIVYHPIGVFQSAQKYPYEAGRQPDENHSPGVIQLEAGNNFEQALTGLEGFSHLWVLFQFHHNTHWKPMVSPPRGTPGKVGVFASRSPYRPNNIGLSVVRLEKIEALKIYVTEADLLDGSPILDIKPYLVYVDAKPEASMGWIVEEEKYKIEWSKTSREQLNWLVTQGVSQLEGFVTHQLEYEPTNGKKKRVKALTPSSLTENFFVLAYRTWRVEFALTDKRIEVLRIGSGYSQVDLAESHSDIYGDKETHRNFLQVFLSQSDPFTS